MNSYQLSDNPDYETINYYNNNAASYSQNTAFLDVSSLYKHFEKFLPVKARILDAGCGSGRDSLYFLKSGYDVIAFDASQEMVKIASELTGLKVLQLYFLDINFQEEFDGIWACASILHVSRNFIDLVFDKLSGALKINGVLYASFKYGKNEEFRNGRLFNDYNNEDFEKLLENHPELAIIDLWLTEDVRPDRKEMWLNCILRKIEIVGHK